MFKSNYFYFHIEFFCFLSPSLYFRYRTLRRPWRCCYCFKVPTTVLCLCSFTLCNEIEDTRRHWNENRGRYREKILQLSFYNVYYVTFVKKTGVDKKAGPEENVFHFSFQNFNSKVYFYVLIYSKCHNFYTVRMALIQYLANLFEIE